MLLDTGCSTGVVLLSSLSARCASSQIQTATALLGDGVLQERRMSTVRIAIVRLGAEWTEEDFFEVAAMERADDGSESTYNMLGFQAILARHELHINRVGIPRLVLSGSECPSCPKSAQET